MLRVAFEKVMWSLVDLLAILTITFILSYLLPGDPARTIAGPHASVADLMRIRTQLGLNKPLYVQFGLYLWHVAHLQFGQSIEYGTPVLAALWSRFPATLELAVTGMVLELAIGLPVGFLAARKQGGVFDRVSGAAGMAAVSLPQFWLGIVLLFFLAFKWRLFPIGGYGSPLWWYVFLPGLTLGIGGAAYYAQLVRARLLEVMNKPFVTTARAKGVRTAQLYKRHIVPNVLSTLVTQIGMDLGYFMAGVVVVETVFGWPGIGLQAWTAIQALDVPLIMGTVLFGAFWIVAANLVVDLTYALMDPRIRVR